MLSFVWRMSGHQFAGVTQLLPLGISSEQAALALQSLQQALGGKVPTKAHEPLKLARDQFAWREFRTSTKFLLCAVANSLKQMLGEKWSLLSCRPGNLLAPKGTTGERYKFLPEELAERADMTGFDCYFIHDHKSGHRFNDFYLTEDFYRLVFSADEGTEAQCFFQTSAILIVLQVYFFKGIE